MWFITVFEKCIPSEYLCDHGDMRCWGYFKSREHAASALEQNVCDMHEGCYDYAVLERIDEGVSAYAGERQFYQFKNGGYVEIPEPECMKRLVNFAIG